jgi:hypothetical protein
MAGSRHVLVTRQVIYGRLRKNYAGRGTLLERDDHGLLFTAAAELPGTEHDEDRHQSNCCDNGPKSRREDTIADSKRHLYCASNAPGLAPMLIKILIVAVLIAIVASLASGLFHLVKDEGKSKRMVNALTVRITLSVLLFILLFVAWRTGLITPHNVR